MLGTQEVLIRARDLVNGDTIFRRTGGNVDYFHILFDQHEIIFADGTPSESLQVSAHTLDKLGEESRKEILELFPELISGEPVSAVSSRMSLKP